MKRFIVAALLIGCVQSRLLSASPTDARKLAAANKGFSFDLLKELSKEQPAANIFISPYSAATVLQMVGSGAAGQTKTEMQQALGIVGMSSDAVGAANKDIVSSLNNINTNVILTTANSVWYKRGEPVKPEFLALNQNFFGSTVESLDFGDPHSVDVINAWANEKTRGKISRIADGIIDAINTRLFLANAVYFKGKWSDPFKPEDTKDRLFYLLGSGQKIIPMMMQSKTFTYRCEMGYQAVRLPYEGENLAMYVFLPDSDSSLEKLLGIMNGDTWQRVTKPGFNQRKGLLVLPKFKLEYSVELKKPLQAMGMTAAFDMKKSDFSGIAPHLFIMAARQKTFVEVQEEGTEAAAVAGVAVAHALDMPPPGPFEMIVDRPFMFLIEDNQTGTILFMGLIFDPQG